MTDKLNARQTAILSAIMIFANKLLTLPGLLFMDVGTDGFWLYIMFFALDIIFICVLITLKKHKVEFKPHAAVKWILKFVFLFYFFAVALLLFNDAFWFVRANVYEELPIYIFLVCILPVAIYAVGTGFTGVARTAEFYFKFILFGAVICALIGIFKIRTLPIFFTSGMPAFSFASLRYLFWFSDFVFLFMIFNHTEYSKELFKKVFSFTLLSIAIILAVTFTFYALFPYTGFFHGSSILDISRISSSHGGIGKLDIIAVLVVLFLLFLQFSIVLKCFLICAKDVLKLKFVHVMWVFSFLFLLAEFFILRGGFL